MRKSLVCLLALALSPWAAQAEEFQILSVDWGDIPSCTTGRPKTVTNPIFELANVPEGPKFVSFKLKDKDAPHFGHGGGVIEYTGNNNIEPGLFKYKSPCPLAVSIHMSGRLRLKRKNAVEN